MAATPGGRRADGSGLRPRGRRGGFTLAEMVVTCAVMLILASVVLPTARVTERRMKEAELKAALRELRYAIDDYKRYSDAGLIPVDLGTDGYPQGARRPGRGRRRGRPDRQEGRSSCAASRATR